MSTIEIAKDSFPWEAIATAFTGLLAVSGAVCVGLKQAAILSRQVDLQALTLRKDLFEQRARIFGLLKEFNLECLAPDWSTQHDSFRKFQTAQHAAGFLFSKGVENRFSNVLQCARILHLENKNIRECPSIAGEKKAGDARNKILLALDELGKAMKVEMSLTKID